MFARANREAILVQYSKRSPCLFRGSASLRNTRAHSCVTPYGDRLLSTAHSVTAMTELACVLGLDPLAKDRAQSRGSSPFGDAELEESRLDAIVFEDEIELAVSRIGASLAGRFLIDPQCFAFPGSFRMPEPLVSALASRRSRPVAVLPLRGSRARRVHARLATIMIAPVRSPCSVVEVAHGLLFHLSVRKSVLRSFPPSRSWFCSCSLTLR
jgi:hypothetical protein